MKYILEGQETERLKFRLLTGDDYDAWLPMFADVATGAFLGMAHLKTSKEQCDNWFEKSLARYDAQRGGMNVLVDKQTNKLVGQCGLLIQDVDDEEKVEVGYSILPEYWHKGYATEAARKCRDYAFENGFSDDIISIIDTQNEGSKKVARNNGMQLWKETDFKGMQVHVYRITKEEWQRLQ